VDRRAAAWEGEGERRTAAQRGGQLMSEGSLRCCMRGNMRRRPLHVEAAQNTRRAGPGPEVVVRDRTARGPSRPPDGMACGSGRPTFHELCVSGGTAAQD
jgi:hypothetical protein